MRIRPRSSGTSFLALLTDVLSPTRLVLGLVSLGLVDSTAPGIMGSLSAQTRIGEPEIVFPEDFGSIQAVRELPDGRVLVADPVGRVLYVVDLDGGTRTVVGQEGQGPREYGQPDATWLLPGDSTLLVDLGNARLVALGPDLSFGPTMPIAMGDPRPGQGGTFMLALPQGVDRQGRIFVRGLSLGGGRGGALPDSGAVLRIDRGTRAVDTLTVVKLQDRTQVQSGGANNRNVSIQAVPMSPEDAWGVAPDGTVVVARAGDRRIDWIEPGGRVIRGDAQPEDGIRVGRPEQEEWLLEQGRSGGGIGVGVSVENGSVSTTLSRGGPGLGGGGEPDVDSYPWPDRTPIWRPSRIVVDPRGRAWVRRYVPAGAPAAYDVFDRGGARVATYELAPGTRVVGFGAESLYAVSFDAFDLSYLERYPIP